MARRLLLARHASTGSKYLGRYLGSTDVEADQAALNGLSGLIPLVRRYRLSHCLASPLIRARQTAERLVMGLGTGLAITSDQDLREIDFGTWEGLTFAEIAGQFPAEVDQWVAAPSTFVFPGGEGIGGFQERVARVAERVQGLSADTVLVVTHGGVVRNMICYLLGISFEHSILFDVQPGTVAVVDLFENGGLLAGLNLGAR